MGVGGLGLGKELRQGGEAGESGWRGGDRIELNLKMKIYSYSAKMTSPWNSAQVLM